MTAPLQYGTPPPSDPTAVMGRRTLAWLADLLLYAAVVAAGFASMAEYTEIPPGIAEADACDVFEQQNPGAADACIATDGNVYLLDGSEAGVQTFLSVGWFAVFVVLQGLTGGSPGKLLFGLRVVDQYGNKAGLAKSLGRTLMWIVDAAPWLIPLVGPITAFTSTGHRRVGDLAAGTYVVSASSVGSPVMPGTAPAPYGQQPWGASPPSAPPPSGQGWPPPTAPPIAPPASTAPMQSSAPATTSGRWESPIRPDDPDLDMRPPADPDPTERADEAPPTVQADPDWSRPPGVAGAPDQPDEAPAPDLSAPTLPDVASPADDWTPPTTPGEAWDATVPAAPPGPEPAPFTAPGAEAPPRPAASAEPEPEATAPPAAEPARYELPPPQWDVARNTYIQWDPNRQAWLQWDTAREQWKPIDT